MECLKMITVYHGAKAHVVPCGSCAFCLTNKRSQWIFRISQELKDQQYPGYFLTLTYDERHVKRTPYGLSLRFRDVQLYCKRLRKEKWTLKYIAVGEYGTETKRPHYHMLIWTDATPEALQKQWYNGNIHFGPITVASAMYTLKYIIQPKQKAENGLEKTRAQFSRGLGLSFLTSSMYDYLTADYDNPKMFVTIEGAKVALPRYYKQKIYTKHQMRRQAEKSKWESIRKRRKAMREALAIGIKGSKKYLDQLRAIEASRILETTKYGTTL